MNISKEEVESLYRQAGQEVDVEEAQFVYEGDFVDTPGTRKRINDAVDELGLGYELQEFQVTISPFYSSVKLLPDRANTRPRHKASLRSEMV
jgi:hypothetical protein